VSLGLGELVGLELILLDCLLAGSAVILKMWGSWKVVKGSL
jgi:hypothetical protein